MPFPTTAILDNFNRANTGPPPSASWSQGYGGIFGQFKVVSNQAAVNSLIFGYAENYWNVATYADCEAYVTIAAKPAAGSLFALMVRTVDIATNPDGYLLVLTPSAGTDTLQIDRGDNGVRTLLGAAVSQEVSVGDSIGIRAIGSTLTCWYKPSGGSWTELFSRTDATYSAAGRIELITNSAATIVDDFGGGTYVPIAITGGAVSTASGSGASDYTPAPSGTTYTLAGGAVSIAAGSGAASKILTLAGGAVSALTGSGTVVEVYSVSGSAASTLTGSGSAAGVYSVAGAVVSIFTGSGASEYITPGGTTYALAGGATAALTGSGAGQKEYSVSGAATSTLAGSGTTGMVFGVSGSASAIAAGSGLPVMTFALVGGAAALFAGLGSVAVVWPTSGGAVSEFSGSGPAEYFNGSIVTPDERRYDITAELRALIVAAENRSLGVSAETRSLVIAGENRTTTIEEEVRIFYAG